MASFFLDETTGKRYILNRPFTYGDINYTKQGATKETFESLGFTEVVVSRPPDSRFYTYSGPLADGTYNITPRNLEDLKISFKQKEKQNARNILSDTDWMVIRETEKPTKPMGSQYKQHRSDVRDICQAREGAIDACTTVEELQDAINNFADYPSFAEE